MSWLQFVKHKNGSISWWIRDSRDDREVSIFAGDTEDVALIAKLKYDARLELQKSGYDDEYTPEQKSLLDQVWGSTEKEKNNGMG